MAIPAKPKRFTVSLVSRIHCFVSEHAFAENKEFVDASLQYGSDIGHGTRYIGFAGRQHVEYRGRGARAAVCYLYGIAAWTPGVVSEVFFRGPCSTEDMKAFQAIVEDLSDKDPDFVRRFYDMGADYAKRSLGIDVK